MIDLHEGVLQAFVDARGHYDLLGYRRTAGMRIMLPHETHVPAERCACGLTPAKHAQYGRAPCAPASAAVTCSQGAA